MTLLDIFCEIKTIKDDDYTRLRSEKMFNAGIYCRVSVEEAVKVDKYSNSIHSQVKMGQEYISEQQDITFVSSYLDDGISGSNFDRPEFRRMLADIELGKINMVIIKDVSRLGREHIDTNYYLGKYFPEKGIRVVSLLDHYDSKFGIYDEIMDIKTLMNDMYLRDTSKKIKSVIRTKRSMGEYTPKEPPYGYIKSKSVHNHLEVDEYAAKVVKMIYQMYLNGSGHSVIARALNEDEVLCPSRYKKEILKTGYPYPTGKGVWTKSAVSAILQNPVYTGAIVLRKTEKPSYKLKYKRQIPLAERELCENAHEAIISKEQFEEAQRKRKERRITCFDESAPPHKYAGVLFCGKCGYAMRKRYLASRSGYDGYMCGAHKAVGQGYCELNHITFEKLDELVVFAINQQIKKVKSEWKQLDAEINCMSDSGKGKSEQIQRNMERNKEYCKKAYEQYMDEILNKEEYLELKSMYEKELKQYQLELRKLEQGILEKQRVVDEAIQWLARFRNGRITERQLTGEFLKEMIEKIYVYPDQQIEIHFRFCNPAEEGRI